MRSSPPRPSTYHNVCVFCAHHLYSQVRTRQGTLPSVLQRRTQVQSLFSKSARTLPRGTQKRSYRTSQPAPKPEVSSFPSVDDNTPKPNPWPSNTSWSSGSPAFSGGGGWARGDDVVELSPEETRVRDLVGKERRKEEGSGIGGPAVEHEKNWTKAKNDGLVWTIGKRDSVVNHIKTDPPGPIQRFKQPWQANSSLREGRSDRQGKPIVTSELPVHSMPSNETLEFSCANCGSKNRQGRLRCLYCGISTSPRIVKKSHVQQKPNGSSQSGNTLPSNWDPTSEWKHLRKVMPLVRKGKGQPEAEKRMQEVNREARRIEERKQRELLDKILQENRRDYVPLSGDQLQAGKSEKSSDKRKSLDGNTTWRESFLGLGSIEIPQSSQSTTTPAQTAQSSTMITTLPSQPSPRTTQPSPSSTTVAQTSLSSTESQPSLSSWATWTSPLEDLKEKQAKNAEDRSAQPQEQPKKTKPVTSSIIRKIHLGQPEEIKKVEPAKHEYNLTPSGQDSSKGRENAQTSQKPIEQYQLNRGTSSIPLSESTVAPPSQSSTETELPSSSWAAWIPPVQDLEEQRSAEAEDQTIPNPVGSQEPSEKTKTDQNSPPVIRRLYKAFDTGPPPNLPPAEHEHRIIAVIAENQDRAEFRKNDLISIPIVRGVLARKRGLGTGSTYYDSTSSYSDADTRDTTHTRNYLRVREREDREAHGRFNDHYGDGDEDDSTESRAERKQRRKQEKLARRAAGPPMPIILPEFISIGNLATALHVRTEEFIQKMVSLGFEETNGDYVLDAETAGLIATEFNFEPIIERGLDEDLIPQPPAEDKSCLPSRPPVVTIMGHVDHGKTTLLDYLRKSSVAASEHGGITQHIGAFKVSMPSGKIATFLDTPGHAAFLNMRQRGANVTDIVILVVAADDSVKPQTIEAIKHAQAAKVPMIVAINKVDKGNSNVEQVKQDLARHGVDVEDFGGETQVVCVSGKTGFGMTELEDATIALADVLDMRAEIDGQAEGWVLEATTKPKGRVATVLVRRGTIYPGNVVVAGTTWAKVRTMKNEAGATIMAAGPGTPVEIDGWREQPDAGDEVLQANDEQHAKSVVEVRLERARNTQLAVDMTAINEARRIEQEKRLHEKRDGEEQLADYEGRQAVSNSPSEQSSGVRDAHFVVKADVSGSVEAVVNSISALGNEEVRANILRAAVGSVTEFDVEHAAAAKGHIICFNVSVDQGIARKAETAGVEIIDQNIIYKLIDDVTARLTHQLAPTVTTRVLGEAEIAQVFEINTKGRQFTCVAGCKVRNGVVSRTAKTRVLRNREVIYDGNLSSLKNQKKDVAEMRRGNECGLAFEAFTEFRVGDQVQCYEEIVEKRTL